MIPHIGLAQSTSQMDWSKLELAVFAKDPAAAQGLVALPDSKSSVKIQLTAEGNSWKPAANPLGGKVTWQTRVVGKP